MARVILCLPLLMIGCATIPVEYTASNYIRYTGEAAIGDFSYVPAGNGRVRANQIQNTALGSIYPGFPIWKREPWIGFFD